jgi:hypothetical protein
MYKFQRITDGPNRGAYGHPQFIRGHVELSRTISRGEKHPVVEEDKKAILPSDAQTKMVSSSPLPLVQVLSSRNVGCFNIAEVVPYEFTKSLNSLPSLDLKLLNYTVLNSELSTPVDILDEIISTFGASPCPIYESSFDGDMDIGDELSFLLM